MMELLASENDNRNYLFEKMRQDKELAESECFRTPEICLGKEIPVPYKHTYFPQYGKFKIWCFKQDICLYKEIFDKGIGKNDMFMIAGDIPVLDIELNKGSRNAVGCPYVLIETKMRDHLDTHQLLAYSEKIRMIKSIFPFCVSILLVFGEFTRGALRHGFEFDEVFFMENFSDVSYNNFIAIIVGSLHKATSKEIYIA